MRGFILSVYNKTGDLLAHLDMFKYCPFPHKLIIIRLKDEFPEEVERELENYNCYYKETPGFYCGTLLSLTEGIAKAKELGIDHLCYKNCDDWCFNWKFEDNNFHNMEKSYKCCAYNWLSTDTYDDFAMNQLYVHVPTFYDSLEKAEKFFKTPKISKEFRKKYMSPKGEILCEFKVSQWIMSLLEMQDIYRIPGRERFPGIGHDFGALTYIYEKIMGRPIPEEALEGYENNNRWFNKQWQLISSHSNRTRYAMWEDIKEDVPYADSLEKEKWFGKWIESVKLGLQWNMKKENTPDKPAKRISSKRRLFT